MKFRFLFIALFAALLVKANPPAEEGKAIFQSRCAGCHNVNKVLAGPALAGVDERRTMDWIINFVHSSQTVIKSGDKDAIALFEKFNKIPMPDHKDLTADHIKSIVEYIKVEAKSGGVEKPPFAKPKKLQPNYIPVSITNYSFFIGYLGLVALLIAAMLLAVKVKSIQRNKQAKD